LQVDWQNGVPKLGSSSPILILLHGLTGGSHESYIQDVIEGVSPFGLHCLVFNFRGCSDTQITTPQLYSASYTQDLKTVINYVQDLLGKDIVLYGCGFSLGANILLKFAGETGSECPFTGLVSIANPFDLTATNTEVHGSLIKRNIYSQRLASNLIRVLKQHMHIFEGNTLYDWDKVLKSRYLVFW
jgi:predicted alpha/beta-fold hydrolase